MRRQDCDLAIKCVNRDSNSALTLKFTRNTCSQCYTRFTGLFTSLQNRPTFKIICGHKFCLIQKYHAFLLKNLVFKSENRHQHIEFDNTWSYNWFSKNAFLQTCKYRRVKRLKHWLLKGLLLQHLFQGYSSVQEFDFQSSVTARTTCYTHSSLHPPTHTSTLQQPKPRCDTKHSSSSSTSTSSR